MTGALFVAAIIATPLALGLPLVRCASIRNFSPLAKAAVAWSGGVVFLTVLLTVCSALGVAWRWWSVALFAAAAIGVALRPPTSPDRAHSRTSDVDWGAGAAAGFCIAVAGIAAVGFSAGAATSADLSYVWGAKAVHFAVNHGMDFQWMQQPHLIHLHPNYPPLWPVLLAWGAMIAGSMPWTTVPLLTLAFLIAAGLVVHAVLRPRLGSRNAALVTCLWFVVLTGSTLRSFSGGSAEGPLLLFVTVAVTVLVAETRNEPPTLRWLAAGALAGAVLSKSEGAIAAALVIVGTVVRDRVWGRVGGVRSAVQLAAPAVFMAGMWAAIRMGHGVPLTDPIRETAMHMHLDDLDVILKVCARLLVTGTLWVGWLAPLVGVASVRPVQPLRALPGLFVVLGIPVFAATYYLHAIGNPLELIVWTFPRLIQPAVSAWIVCLGLLCFPPRATLPERGT